MCVRCKAFSLEAEERERGKTSLFFGVAAAAENGGGGGIRRERVLLASHTHASSEETVALWPVVFLRFSGGRQASAQHKEKEEETIRDKAQTE